jgi:hypothetical protein
MPRSPGMMLCGVLFFACLALYQLVRKLDRRSGT